MDTNEAGFNAGLIDSNRFSGLTDVQEILKLRPTKLLKTARFALLLSLTLAVHVGSLATSSLAAGMKLGDMCRLKGQETNTLQGLGLVVGLRGTGDTDAAPTARALARMMQLMGGPMAIGPSGQLNLDDVSDSKNVALVFVTATIPAAGAQPGDLLNVSVNAINAKSLEGGTLMLTPMLGPRADNPTVYAMSQGPLKVSADGPATTATIEGGAKMEAAVEASYQKDGLITLVLEKDLASFDTAQLVEEEINNVSELTGLGSPNSGLANRPRARAMDQVHIEVEIPPNYRQNPIKFISFLLNIKIQLASRSSRVVINEREGVVVIGNDVEIAPVLVTHRSLRIEAGGGGGFVEVGDDSDEQANAKLKSLADALNALDVPTEDLIAIIKTLKRKGDLFGEVVFQ
jgi:flagellar P-ring protein precursor FlgI